jgi:hypothetical protein
MANSDHLAQLKKNVTQWNIWRTRNSGVVLDLARTNLSEAKFHGTVLVATVLGNTSLRDVQGLESCTHEGPSILDYWTLVILS